MNKFYSTVLVAAAAICAPTFADAATAQDVIITIDRDNGSFYKSGSTLTTADGGCVNLWKSTSTDPQLKLNVYNWNDAAKTSGAASNNLALGGTGFRPHTGIYCCEYRLSVASGQYYISHVSFDVKSISTPTAGKPITCTLGSASCVTNTTDYQTLSSDFAQGDDVMFSFSGAGSNHQQEVINCQVTLTPYSLPSTITYAYRDQRGCHLIPPVKVEVPAGEPYVINQEEKSFPNCTFASASPLQGTTVTPEPEGNILVVANYNYNGNAIPGVVSKALSVTSLEAGHTYLIENDQPIDRDDRRGFRYYDPSNGGIFANTNEVDATPFMTWTLTEAENGYKIVNNGNDLQVAPLTSGGQSNPTMIENGETFTLTYSGSNWAIAGSNGMCWNGNPNNKPLVGWTSSHPHQMWEYVVQPYYAVDVYHIITAKEASENDAPVIFSMERHLVKEGGSLELPAPPATISADGYNVPLEKFLSEGDDDLSNITGHKQVFHFYDSQTAVESISADTKAAVIYDLMGRKVANPTTPGLYIINGKKILIK